jgi:3-oxoacyl-[acyl-carrier protein] reductase
VVQSSFQSQYTDPRYEIIDIVIETGLKDKVVIVTGAAGGIGQATARLFAKEGCRVASWDIRDGEAENGCIFQKVDVTSAASVEAATRELVSRWKTPYVLVNNAGILRDALLVKYKNGAVTSTLTDEQFDAVLSVNVNGVVTCTRAIVPHMIAGGGGVILNASSVVALYGNTGQTSYVASKAAVIELTSTWARELGPHKIRVNAVAPGLIESILEHTPLGRIGQPDDVANVYLWLASDAASFITGTVLSVDGGTIPGT